MSTTDSAADLHRYVCEPWCPVHGWGQCQQIPQVELQAAGCPECKLPLWERDPRTKVEGLELEHGHWMLDPLPHLALKDDTHRYKALLADNLVADLLVMEAEKALLASQFNFTIWQDKDAVEYDIEPDNRPNIRAKAATRPEAVAIAYHRMLDAEEEGHA